MSKVDYLNTKFSKNVIRDLYCANSINANFIAYSAIETYPKPSRELVENARNAVYGKNYFTNSTHPISSGDRFARSLQAIRSATSLSKRTWMPLLGSRSLDADITLFLLLRDPIGGNFLISKIMQPIYRESRSYLSDGFSSPTQQYPINQRYWGRGRYKAMLLEADLESRLTT
jgi:hypothetical protein